MSQDPLKNSKFENITDWVRDPTRDCIWKFTLESKFGAFVHFLKMVVSRVYTNVKIAFVTGVNLLPSC